MVRSTLRGTSGRSLYMNSRGESAPLLMKWGAPVLLEGPNGWSYPSTTSHRTSKRLPGNETNGKMASKKFHLYRDEDILGVLHE
ncbi:hypothetical protein Syun_001802 [Stephania yunnanensis]|uniref:Uncharacterized protein n=1 Tax=Stephania yunnanensis TaxID=152371 RepID=A0AAP0LEC6_9MAGN